MLDVDNDGEEGYGRRNLRGADAPNVGVMTSCGVEGAEEKESGARSLSCVPCKGRPDWWEMERDR